MITLVVAGVVVACAMVTEAMIAATKQGSLPCSLRDYERLEVALLQVIHLYQPAPTPETVRADYAPTMRQQARGAGIAQRLIRGDSGGADSKVEASMTASRVLVARYWKVSTRHAAAGTFLCRRVVWAYSVDVV
jgi:hypothetical protein